MKMKILALLCLIGLVAVSGCILKEDTAQAQAPAPSVDRISIVYETQNTREHIRVLHDNELNVTIYTVSNVQGALSVSAIPDKELDI